MMRAVLVLCLLAFAACDSTTEPEPVVDATGVWVLEASAGACSLHMRAVIDEGTLDGFSGYGALEVRKASGATDPWVQFEGDRGALRVTEVYRQAWAPFSVDPFTLSASEAEADRIGGAWSCDGAAGAWTLEREG